MNNLDVLGLGHLGPGLADPIVDIEPADLVAVLCGGIEGL